MKSAAVVAIAIWPLFFATAHAQSVEECMAELQKVQQFIGDQPNSNAPQYDEATDHLETAEVEASQGNGEKCMQFVNEAKGAARYVE